MQAQHTMGTEVFMTIDQYLHDFWLVLHLLTFGGSFSHDLCVSFHSLVDLIVG